MTNISLLEMGKIKKRNVRETIISILSNEFPLNIRKIYNKVKKEHNLNVSYQAVFKIIKEMVDDRILEKIEREYKLNIKWIKEVENELNMIKKNYNKETDSSKENPMHNRISLFVSEIGPKIKEYAGKDELCVIAVSGGGKLFANALVIYLLKEGLNPKYYEINWLSKDDDESFFKKIDMKDKKLLFVDSAIYSGITYRRTIEKITKVKNKIGIKDIKFAVDTDTQGLADFSRIR